MFYQSQSQSDCNKEEHLSVTSLWIVKLIFAVSLIRQEVRNEKFRLEFIHPCDIQKSIAEIRVSKHDLLDAGL